MKGLYVCFFALAMLAGCSSTGVKSQADATSSQAVLAKQAQANNIGSTNQSGSSDTSAPATHSIYFSFDQYSITEADKPVLAVNAKYLKQHSGTKIVMQGNTDERGSSEYNLALGNRRAESAKQALSMLGVAAKNIEVVSFGKEKPKAECHDESCWSENRRADIVYSSNN
jgi:peptidoglycan-associated lipoprotein